MDASAPLPDTSLPEGRRARWMARRLLGPGIGRPAPLAALRVALALAAPLLVGLAVGRRDLAVLATIAALFTAIVEPGGGYGRHLRVYAVMTVLNALVTILAIAAAGHAIAAGLVMLALGVIAGAVTAWGSVPGSVAPTCLILFIVAQAFHPSPELLPAVIAVAAGSAWVAMISVLPWPIAPYAPADIAVAGAWRAIADLAGRPSDDRLRESAITALDAARDGVASVRSRRPGWSNQSARLWASLVAGSRVVSLVTAVDDERRREAAEPDIRHAMDGVLAAVADAARDLSIRVIDPAHDVPTGTLATAVAALRATGPDPSGLTGPALHSALIARGRLRSAMRLERRIGDARDALALPEPPRAHIERSRRSQAPASLRTAFDPRSTGLRHGLRLGLATGASVGVFTALAGTPVIGITHGQWVSIALVGVLRPTLGDSVPVAAQRAVGTALGAVVALVLLALLSGSPWALAGAIVLVGAIAAWLEPVNYLWFIVMFTPLSLLMSAWGLGLDAAIALERLIATGIACGGGLLLVAFAWPTRSGEQLPGVLATALRAAADDLRTAMTVAEDGATRGHMTEVHRTATVAVDEAARVTQARMAESIDAFSRPDALAALEATAMQLVRDLGTLTARIPLEGVHVPGLRTARERMTQAIQQVADALEAGTAPPHMGEVIECLGPAHDAVARAEQGGHVEKGLVGTVDMLDTIAHAIDRLAEEARLWSTQRASAERSWWRRLAPAPEGATAH